MCFFLKGSLLSIEFVLEDELMHHPNNNKKNNHVIITVATLVTLTTIIVLMSGGATTPVAATTTTTASNTTTTSTAPSSGLELSPQPIWDEQATTTSRIQINETHSIISFIGNGTMTVPDTGETINMTNNGTGLVSPVPGYTDTVSAYGREHLFSEDDDKLSHFMKLYGTTLRPSKGRDL
jgi:hypothetical protein